MRSNSSWRSGSPYGDGSSLTPRMMRARLSPSACGATMWPHSNTTVMYSATGTQLTTSATVRAPGAPATCL